MNRLLLPLLVCLALLLWLTNPTNRDAMAAMEINFHLLPEHLTKHRLKICRIDYWLFSEFQLRCESCPDKGASYHVFSGFLGKVYLDQMRLMNPHIRPGFFGSSHHLYEECQEFGFEFRPKVR